MSSPDLTIRIRAVDQASAVAKKVGDSVTKAMSPLEKVGNRFGAIGKTGTYALDGINSRMRDISNGARTVSDRIASIVPGFAAIAGLASVAGLGKLAERFSMVGFSLTKTSRILGMSAQNLAQWQYAAKKAGVTADQLNESMGSSRSAIRNASMGADPHAMQMMNQLKVGISRNSDGSVDYEKTQVDLMRQLSKVKNRAAQQAAAETVGMGSILPMIQNGTWDADRTQALVNGAAPSNDAIERAAKFQTQIIELHASIEGMANAIGSSLIPVLTPMITKMTSWLNTNQDILSGFGEWAVVLGSLAALRVGAMVLGWIVPITALASSLGAVVTAARAVGAIGAAGSLGVMAGVAGVASYGALQLAKMMGLPDTDYARGASAMRNGDTFGASKYMPAGDFIGSMWGKLTGKDPLGIRTNNPTNILNKGQQLSYPTAEAGIAAAARNLKRSYTGLSIDQITDKWTGGARTGNTPQQMSNYSGILSRSTGLSGGQVPDLNNQTILANLIKGQIMAENGKQPYSDAQIKEGITVHVNVVAPSGTRVDAKRDDGMYMPTKVNYSMPGGMP